MKRPELLIPAGNLEKLRTAVLYGADAVYVGVEGLSLRAGSAEFGLDELAAGIGEAHKNRVNVYAAMNIFARNSDLRTIKKTVPLLNEMKIDGIIASDPGVIGIIQQLAPDLPIHLSTQANTTNSEAVKVWETHGIRRVVLARELSLLEIREIAADNPEVELEIFVHGAMCVAYSGRCFLSSLRTGRSSNSGDCTQPCRWEYILTESTRPGQPLVLEEDERYSYILSSNDLCMIEYLPQILAAGVTSLKVEGRMKSAYYVAVVARTYRWALDKLMENPASYQCQVEWLAELGKISNRGYTTGFYFADGEKVHAINPDVKYLQTYDLVGTVLNYDAQNGQILAGVRNRLSAVDEVELLLPDDTLRLDCRQMRDSDRIPVSAAHNGYRVYLPVDREVPVGAVIRRKM